MKLMVLIFFICLIIPMMIYLLSLFLYMREMENRHKLVSFECGFDSFLNARVPFSMRFFLLAVIFIVFDIEIVLLFPIPMLMNLNNMNLIIITLVFFLLLFGLLHEWNEGAIDWMK
uniref:NADH-ubiquinone oxidoreductase chain 3 n=1 Tax=Haemadipsa tianmushana TaxID=2301367 RepID=A0A8F9RZW9_9ANNE|nr:NADH dehydrogenase subunit 3 [Haemadipsa tianmushana]